MLHFCPPATEVFNSPDSPADAGIMNSQMFSNFPHPIPMIHIKMRQTNFMVACSAFIVPIAGREDEEAE